MKICEMKGHTILNKRVKKQGSLMPHIREDVLPRIKQVQWGIYIWTLQLLTVYTTNVSFKVSKLGWIGLDIE